MQTKNQPSPYGANTKRKTLGEFSALVRAEVKHAQQLLAAEFAEKQELLINSAERKIAEYEFIGRIIEANSNEYAGAVNPQLLMQIEIRCAGLNYDNVCASYQLSYWQRQYGEHIIMPVLCDVISYFLRQFQVKENLSDNQVMLMATKLLALHPQLRLMELIFVLTNALNGVYGPTYQRIGIDTILVWLQQFFKDASQHLETKMSSKQPDENRGEMPWHLIEQRAKQYQEEINRKAEANSKAFAAEKRKREIEEELNRINHTQNSHA